MYIRYPVAAVRSFAVFAVFATVREQLLRTAIGRERKRKKGKERQKKKKKKSYAAHQTFVCMKIFNGRAPPFPATHVPRSVPSHSPKTELPCCGNTSLNLARRPSQLPRSLVCIAHPNVIATSEWEGPSLRPWILRAAIYGWLTHVHM